MRYFLYTIKGSNVVQSIDARGKSAVKTENLVVDERSEGKVIEQIGKILPNVRVAVLPETFIVETINLRDLAGFMITTKDCDALRVSDFECNEEGDRLNRVIASVNIITCPKKSVSERSKL